MRNSKKESWFEPIKEWSPWVLIILSAFGYISTIEKQVLLQGQKIQSIEIRENELKQEIYQSNIAQDNNVLRLQSAINAQLEKMNDKIDQIYSMTAKRHKN